MSSSSSIPQPVQEKISIISKELSQLKGLIQHISSQIHSCEYETKLISLTQRELSQLPQENRCFQSIGKMFLRQDLSKLQDEIQQSSLQLAKELKELKMIFPSLEASY